MTLWASAIPRKITFHGLSHSAATVLLRTGVDIHRVQRILRHADVKITAAVYAHLLTDDLRAGLAQAFGERPATPLPMLGAAAASGIRKDSKPASSQRKY